MLSCTNSTFIAKEGMISMREARYKTILSCTNYAFIAKKGMI